MLLIPITLLFLISLDLSDSHAIRTRDSSSLRTGGGRPPLDIPQLIDPLQQQSQSETEDQLRRTKSVFSVPLRSQSSNVPECAPGTRRVSENGPCIHEAPIIKSSGDKFLVDSLRKFYAPSSNGHRPHHRKRKTTTTTTTTSTTAAPYDLVPTYITGDRNESNGGDESFNGFSTTPRINMSTTLVSPEESFVSTEAPFILPSSQSISELSKIHNQSKPSVNSTPATIENPIETALNYNQSEIESTTLLIEDPPDILNFTNDPDLDSNTESVITEIPDTTNNGEDHTEEMSTLPVSQDSSDFFEAIANANANVNPELESENTTLTETHSKNELPIIAPSLENTTSIEIDETTLGDQLLLENVELDPAHFTETAPTTLPFVRLKSQNPIIVTSNAFNHQVPSERSTFSTVSFQPLPPPLPSVIKSRSSNDNKNNDFKVQTNIHTSNNNRNYNKENIYQNDYFSLDYIDMTNNQRIY